MLVYDKLKYKRTYTKINVIILNKLHNNYKIKIAKDYKKYNISKNDIYLCSFKLLKKCSEEAWENYLVSKSFNHYDFDDVVDDNIIVSDYEENYILEHQLELNK